MGVVEVLAEHPGRLVSKEELVEEVWGSVPDGVTDDVISRAMSGVRKALGDSDPEHPIFIKTVQGRGFRFIAEVDRDEPIHPSESTSTGKFVTNPEDPGQPEEVAPCFVFLASDDSS